MTDLSLTRRMTFKPDARYQPIACGRFRDQTSLQAESCRSDGTRLPGLSCLTGRHLSSCVNSLLMDPHEFSSESPQRFHSVFARVEETIEALSREARRTRVAKYLLSS